MLYLAIKAALSGIIIAIVSEVARRNSGIGGLIVSLPLISLFTFIWLWRDTGDTTRIAELSHSAFWFFLPSMPMFLVLPALLRAGLGFWLALALSCTLTIALYGAMTLIAPRFGLRL